MNSTTWHVLTLLLLVAAVLESVALIGIMRTVGAISLRIGPTRLGEVEGGPDMGSVVATEGLAADRPSLLVFMSPQCSVCKPLIPLLPIVTSHFPEVDVIAAIIGGNDAERETYATQIGGAARLDLGGLEREWDIEGTPYAVGLAGGGLVRGKGVVNSLEHLEALAEEILAPLPSPREESDDDDDQARVLELDGAVTL